MTLTSAASSTTTLNTGNPWPGLAPFSERARDSFNGREVEAEELLRRVTTAPLTVLFGKSGLGKTSLLQAGLFPRLRRCNILPVYVRLQIRADVPPLIEQMRVALLAQMAESQVEAPSFAEHESLWEYLHRRELELWSTTNYLVTPLFVLDQFEEVFTLGEQAPQAIEEFRFALGNLAENRIPSLIAERLESSQNEQDALDVRALRYGVLLCLREDFLPHLEGWRRAIPSLGRNRMRLLPMSRQQAYAAVHATAPHLTSEALAWKIVDFVSAASLRRTSENSSALDAETLGLSTQESDSAQGEVGGTIEPALLSLFCSGLYERHKKLCRDLEALPPFDESLLEGAKEAIIADYYRECLQGLPSTVSRFIEEELITDRGYRNSYAVEDAIGHGLIASEELDLLINRRLLRRAEQYDVVRVELTHDVLTQAVREERDQRRAREEKQREEEERARTEISQRNRLRWRIAIIALVCVSVATILLARLYLYTAEQQKIAKEQREIAEQQKLLAEQQRSEADQQRQLAEQERKVADQQRRYAEDRLKEAVKAQNGLKNIVRVNQRKAFAKRELEQYILSNPNIYEVSSDISERARRTFNLTRPDSEVMLGIVKPPLQSDSTAESWLKSLSSLRPRIYIQIQSEQQKQKAEALREALRGKGYDAPGIELLNVGPTANSEVRFFKKAEEEGANRILSLLQSSNVNNSVVTYIPGYEDSKKIRARHFEIWFAPDALTD